MRRKESPLVKRGPHAGEAVFGFHENDIHVWTSEKNQAFSRKLHVHSEASRLRSEARESKEVGTNAHLRRVRGEWFDDQSKAANTAKVSVFKHGMGIRIERRQDGYSWAGAGAGEGGGKRGTIKGFSAASAARFRDKVWQLRRSVVPVMVTLTYPLGRVPSPERCKRDLNAFCKAIDRKYPKAAGFWKLEFTERGVPHYHFLVWNAQPWKNWIARTWFRICATGDANHLIAGTSVEKLRSYRGTLSYVGKRYLTKMVKSPAGNWGRFWGCFNAKRLPVAQAVEELIPGRLGMWIARTVRRWMRSKTGARRGARGRVVWITSDHIGRWLDCFEYLSVLEASQPVRRHAGI